MKSNESAADRIIRIILGLVLAALVAFKVVTGTAAIVIGIGAAILLITGLAGFCAIYALLGICTCKVPKSN